MSHELVIRNGTIVDGTGADRFTGDVAVDDGVITQVGGERRPREAVRSMPTARVVAPGWVDIHTHYDGQVTWDPEMAPSSWHGATTVVMGNCGVGFAPARPDEHDFLIELMEAVEDIPGHRAARRHRVEVGELRRVPRRARGRCAARIDVGAQVPHAALRAYVSGEAAHEDDLERRASSSR